jgi:hypothetical protein
MQMQLLADQHDRTARSWCGTRYLVKDARQCGIFQEQAKVFFLHNRYTAYCGIELAGV